MQPANYVIIVDGLLPVEELDEFIGMHAIQGSRTTVLRGIVHDQAELVGMIARIEALGGQVRDCQATGPASAGGGRP